MWYENDRIRVFGPSGSRCWPFVLSVGLFQMMQEYGVDPEQGQLASAHASGIDIGVAVESGWFPFNLEASIFYDLRHLII